jgi:hypothetical protein
VKKKETTRRLPSSYLESSTLAQEQPQRWEWKKDVDVDSVLSFLQLLLLEDEEVFLLRVEIAQVRWATKPSSLFRLLPLLLLEEVEWEAMILVRLLVLD